MDLFGDAAEAGVGAPVGVAGATSALDASAEAGALPGLRKTRSIVTAPRSTANTPARMDR